MSVPLRQQFAVASYLFKQKIKGVKKYPLVLMLEPLFKCNLACAGCGKIDYPDDILDKRLSVQECLDAVDECGAPMVSIPGGEPLIHKEMPQIVEGIIARKKFVYLCTNALLLRKRIDDYKPSPYLTFSIHLDGNKHRHDESVCQPGVFDIAVEAIKLALSKGFRVTVNCTLFQGKLLKKWLIFLITPWNWVLKALPSRRALVTNTPPNRMFLLRALMSRICFAAFLKSAKTGNGS